VTLLALSGRERGGMEGGGEMGEEPNEREAGPAVLRRLSGEKEVESKKIT